MNVLEARIDGNVAHVMDCAIPLGRRYGPVKGDKIEIGVRPEFARLSRTGPGLPVSVRRVEDVGRHKIIRTEIAGREINVIAAEGAAVDERAEWVQFAPAYINVYADGWLVQGEGA
jgi:glycerol transport system ATP-binding protein